VRCYRCGKEGHKANKCNEPRQQVQHQEGSSGLFNKNSGVGRGNKGAGQRSYGRGRPTAGKGNQAPGNTAKSAKSNTSVRARVVALNKEDTLAAAVVEGTISLFDIEAVVLIDPGSTHSFIGSQFSCALNLDHKGT
jgi:hypothetical protein